MKSPARGENKGNTKEKQHVHMLVIGCVLMQANVYLSFCYSFLIHSHTTLMGGGGEGRGGGKS